MSPALLLDALSLIVLICFFFSVLGLQMYEKKEGELIYLDFGLMVLEIVLRLKLNFFSDLIESG